MLANFASLNFSLIERGKIEKLTLFESGYFEVAILKLHPGSKIKDHKHHVNNEKYIVIRKKLGGYELKTISVCLRGESHSLENKSIKTIYVLSVKWPPAAYN